MSRMCIVAPDVDSVDKYLVSRIVHRQCTRHDANIAEPATRERDSTSEGPLSNLKSESTHAATEGGNV